MKKIEHFDEWKDIPMAKLCKKQFPKGKELIWHQEWRYFYMNYINKLANYLNRKDPKWDKELNMEMTTMELVTIIRTKLENMGLSFKDRVQIIKEEHNKLK